MAARLAPHDFVTVALPRAEIEIQRPLRFLWLGWIVFTLAVQDVVDLG